MYDIGGIMSSFKQYLIELISTQDNNAIGGAIDSAKKNLTQLSKSQKSLTQVCTDLLSSLEGIEQNPAALYVDGYSVIDFIQRLRNPKIDINSLKTINDAFQSFDGDNENSSIGPIIY
jgi:hypothetical protein